MIDPTALQQARLHIGHIRTAWPHLEDARDATLRRQARVTATISAKAAETRDAELRAERADREHAERYRALPAAPVPANLALVDAEVDAHATVVATIWAVRSDLRQWSRIVPDIPAPFHGKLSWLTGGLGYTSPDVVDQAARDLTTTARRLTTVLGRRLDDDWNPNGRRCPACTQRSLFAWTVSTDTREWTVECRGQVTDDRGHVNPCRCTGTDCPCDRPGARERSHHLWPADRGRTTP